MKRPHQIICLIITMLLSMGLIACEEKGGKAKGKTTQETNKPKPKPSEEADAGSTAKPKPSEEADAGSTAKPEPSEEVDAGSTAKPEESKDAGGAAPTPAPAAGATAEQIVEADAAAARLLVAMQATAVIIEGGLEDGSKTVEAVKKHLADNDAELKVAVTQARKLHGLMTEAQQEEYHTRQTSKPEYQAWATAMEKFEEKQPDHISDLEVLMDEIQSAGAGDDTIVEDE